MRVTDIQITANTSHWADREGKPFGDIGLMNYLFKISIYLFNVTLSLVPFCRSGWIEERRYSSSGMLVFTQTLLRFVANSNNTLPQL